SVPSSSPSESSTVIVSPSTTTTPIPLSHVSTPGQPLSVLAPSSTRAVSPSMKNSPMRPLQPSDPESLPPPSSTSVKTTNASSGSSACQRPSKFGSCATADVVGYPPGSPEPLQPVRSSAAATMSAAAVI